jgi:hypothetical protein
LYLCNVHSRQTGSEAPSLLTLPRSPHLDKDERFLCFWNISGIDCTVGVDLLLYPLY